VPGTATGDQRDLATPGAAGPQDEVLGGVDLDDVRVGLGQSGEALGDDIVDVVVELLDAGRGVGRHGVLLLRGCETGTGQAWSASPRPASATVALGTAAVS
jgi:hypothetical protein